MKVIIFDFDETLFPSNRVLEDIGGQIPCQFDAEGNMQPNETPPELKSALLKEDIKLLEWELTLLLEIAVSISDEVIIVTNSSKGWIDLVVEYFLPTLKELFSTLPKIYCRQQFEKYLLSEEALTYFPKYHGIMQILRQYEPTEMIGVGDQDHDWNSILFTCRDLDVPLRFIKLPHWPLTVPAFINNIVRVCRCLLTFTESSNLLPQCMYVEIHNKYDEETIMPLC